MVHPLVLHDLLTSTSDGLTHFRHFWIGLQPNWVVGLLLILSHRLSYVSIYPSLLDTLNSPCLHFDPRPSSLTLVSHTELLDSISDSCIVADTTVGTPQLAL